VSAICAKNAALARSATLNARCAARPFLHWGGGRTRQRLGSYNFSEVEFLEKNKIEARILHFFEFF
jgi:hypothetical protein